MSNTLDFVIKNGVISECYGPEGQVYGLEGDIVVPEGVREIRETLSVFWFSCRSVVLPNTVKRIGKTTFANNENLEKVHLPDGIKKIGKSAFWGCENLSDIVVPPNTEIEEGAFFNCRKLADDDGFLIFNGTLFNYYGHQKTLVIPDNVTAISNLAFMFSGAKTIIVHDKVNKIAEDAFAHSAALETVILPASMTTITKRTFDHSFGLKCAVLPGVKLDQFKEVRLSPAAAEGFLAHNDAFTDLDIIQDYMLYISENKKRYLPTLFSKDLIHCIDVLAQLGKITPQNIDDFLDGAQAANAVQCVAFLLDWKNKNVSPAQIEKRQKKQQEKLFDL